ncbi:MAG: DUF4402 domain-containing protein [Alphaproteobacteria bacterium]|nr:DUF4402 domain-containing protein [Alphaproteobacteria bacterium]
MRKDSQKPAPNGLKKLATGGLVTLSMFSALALRSVIASTATLPIIVRLVKAIEVTVATSLDFGTLVMDPEEAGRAAINPSLNRLILDNENSLSLAGGTPKVGRLRIKGSAFPVSISIEDTSVHLTNGLTDVTVNNFNFVSADGGTRVTITPQAGQVSFTVPVGATLHTKPGQSEGTYVGTTRIFANFQ